MEVGRCELVLHVRPCEGLMRQLDGTVEKRFAKKEILYPLQVLLKTVVHVLTEGLSPTSVHADTIRRTSSTQLL